MTELQRLLADLRKAERGCNELDVRLEVHVAPLRYGTAKRANSAGTKVIVTYDDGRGGTTQGTGWAGDHSTRVDFALELLGSALPGWQYAIDATAPECGIDAHLFGPGGELSTATHNTLPMAICIAIVQAKIDGVKA